MHFDENLIYMLQETGKTVTLKQKMLLHVDIYNWRNFF